MPNTLKKAHVALDKDAKKSLDKNIDAIGAAIASTKGAAPIDLSSRRANAMATKFNGGNKG